MITKKELEKSIIDGVIIVHKKNEIQKKYNSINVMTIQEAEMSLCRLYQKDNFLKWIKKAEKEIKGKKVGWQCDNCGGCMKIK